MSQDTGGTPQDEEGGGDMMANIMDTFAPTNASGPHGTQFEVISIQVVTFQCGVCMHEYQVELHAGDKKMVNCPDCGNPSLQMIVGTE